MPICYRAKDLDTLPKRMMSGLLSSKDSQFIILQLYYGILRMLREGTRSGPFGIHMPEVIFKDDLVRLQRRLKRDTVAKEEGGDRGISEEFVVNETAEKQLQEILHGMKSVVLQHKGVIWQQDTNQLLKVDHGTTVPRDPTRRLPGEQALLTEAEVREELQRHDLSQFDEFGETAQQVSLAKQALKAVYGNELAERMEQALSWMAKRGLVRGGPVAGFLATALSLLEETSRITISNKYPQYNTLEEQAISIIHEMGAIFGFSDAENDAKEKEVRAWFGKSRESIKAISASQDSRVDGIYLSHQIVEQWIFDGAFSLEIKLKGLDDKSIASAKVQISPDAVTLYTCNDLNCYISGHRLGMEVVVRVFVAGYYLAKLRGWTPKIADR